LDSDKEVLNKRLDNRVDKMLEMGLLQEIISFTMSLQHSGIHVSDFTHGILQAIGFKEFEPILNRIRNRPPVHPTRPLLLSIDNAFLTADNHDECRVDDTKNSEGASPDVTRDQLSTRSSLQCTSHFASSPLSSCESYVRSNHAHTTEVQGSIAVQDTMRSVLLECIDRLKARTRRYAHRQRQWIQNRFAIHRHLMMFRLDTTTIDGDDETTNLIWFEKVVKPSVAIVVDVINGTTLDAHSLLRYPISIVGKYSESCLDVNRIFYCEICSRDISGERQWQVHLNSKCHRKKIQRKIKQPLIEEYKSRKRQSNSVVADLTDCQNDNTPTIGE
jgi:hypothetical protein